MSDQHRPAPRPIRWLLYWLDAGGIVMPWSVAYYYHYPPSLWLRRHEEMHLRQIERYGAVGFVARYLWLLARHGYHDHPLEIEARACE